MKKGKIALLSFVVLIFIAVLGYNGYKFYKLFEKSSNSVVNFNYNNKLNIDYNVKIKPNEFITSPTMPNSRTYITKYVDSIEFTYTYTYSASESITLNEDHRIIATLYTVYNESPTGDNNPVIWEKEYLIKNTVKKTNIVDSTVMVSETFTINLVDYNNDALRFKNSVTVPTVSYLQVLMPIRLQGENDTYSINETQVLSSKIPLTEEVFSIEALLEKNNEATATILKDTSVAVNSKEASIHFIFIVLSIFFIVMAIKNMTASKEDEVFVTYVEKLKKEFNDIVVETNNMVDTKTLKPIVITTFEELLNLANSLEMPIMLYEENNVACFYIVKGDIIYSFLVKREKK